MGELEKEFSERVNELRIDELANLIYTNTVEELSKSDNIDNVRRVASSLVDDDGIDEFVDMYLDDKENFYSIFRISCRAYIDDIYHNEPLRFEKMYFGYKNGMLYMEFLK